MQQERSLSKVFLPFHPFISLPILLILSHKMLEITARMGFPLEGNGDEVGTEDRKERKRRKLANDDKSKLEGVSR